jgi:ATP-dependent helicase/nuclease subunit B
MEQLLRTFAMLQLEAWSHHSINEIEEALAQADIFEAIDVRGFATLLEQQLQQPTRSPTISAHPRVMMLTPVEARLLACDRVILATMTADRWPGRAPQSPWLNQSQQEALGLPGYAQHVALAAQDLVTLSTASEVYYTYAQREGGQPTETSPFLEKLAAYYALHGIDASAHTADHYRHWANTLDASDAFTPSTPPMPHPVAALRPKHLKVTALDRLFSDPYSIYAEYILKLKEREPFDAELEPKDFGSLAHHAIQALCDYWQQHQRPMTESERQAYLEQLLEPYATRPAVQHFWHKRLEQALQFINHQETQRRASLTQVLSEQPVRAEIAGLELEGRIDRLEYTATGIRIIDYKTGTAPSAKHIREGKAAQLLAYALILTSQQAKLESLEYWQLPKANAEGVIHAAEYDGDWVEAHRSALERALTQLSDPHTPLLARPIPHSSHYESPYDGISRYDEWAG